LKAARGKEEAVSGLINDVIVTMHTLFAALESIKGRQISKRTRSLNYGILQLEKCWAASSCRQVAVKGTLEGFAKTKGNLKPDNPSTFPNSSERKGGFPSF